jgi:hypothetical protein
VSTSTVLFQICHDITEILLKGALHTIIMFQKHKMPTASVA